MRMSQYIGLNAWALKTVSRTILVREVGARIMPDNSVISFDREVDLPLATKTVIGTISSEMGEDKAVANLHRYTFASGVVYEEYVQCTPHCGGPMYYIALRRPSGKFLKQSLWPSSETQIREEYNNSATMA